MTYKERQTDSPRSDQRFIATAFTETGVELRGESDWVPSHWDSDKPRREAIVEVLKQIKRAESLNVKVEPIRVYWEVKRTERVVKIWTSKKFDSEVTK